VTPPPRPPNPAGRATTDNSPSHKPRSVAWIRSSHTAWPAPPPRAPRMTIRP
jgi:hypothetical protein